STVGSTNSKCRLGTRRRTRSRTKKPMACLSAEWSTTRLTEHACYPMKSTSSRVSRSTEGGRVIHATTSQHLRRQPAQEGQHVPGPGGGAAGVGLAAEGPV